jgi:hypothetical protein
MNLKEFGSKIAGLAPLLGGAFLGPAGAAGGTLLKVVAGAFGLKDDAKPAEVYQAIQQDPDALVKLREIEYKEKELILTTTLQNRIAEFGDTKSARGREVEITKATGKLNVAMYLLAAVIVVGFFVLIYYLMKTAIPAGNKDVAIMLFGTLSTSFGLVVGYFFGSSKSSADKTSFMAQGKG